MCRNVAYMCGCQCVCGCAHLSFPLDLVEILKELRKYSRNRQLRKARRSRHEADFPMLRSVVPVAVQSYLWKFLGSLETRSITHGVLSITARKNFRLLLLNSCAMRKCPRR